jgi:hypothetical protein
VNTGLSVLWRAHGQMKQIECTITPHPAGFELRVERGSEREVFWSSLSASLPDALKVSSIIRQRLTTHGWTLIDADGERSLEQQVARRHKMPAA